MIQKNPIRIGTRDSQLALWQAHKVKNLLEQEGYECELIAVKSEGDLDLVTPLYAMGVQGVFTKTLDAYLLSNKIEIAVHSMKDVPVQLAKGIKQGAVLNRGAVEDIIVWKEKAYTAEELQEMNATIGTGSIRRKSQWLNKYPHHKIENLRGNVQTRLRKLEESNWIGAIFAKAGLERMELLEKEYTILDWMLPSPAQGALMIVCRYEDVLMQKALSALNNNTVAACVSQERDFLALLHGGCSAPIGAYCRVENDSFIFEGNIAQLDGSQLEYIRLEGSLKDQNIGKRAAEQLLERGADKIVAAIRQ